MPTTHTLSGTHSSEGTNSWRFAMTCLALSLGLFLAGPTQAAGMLDKEAADTIALFKKVDPGLAKFFESSAGYAVFPKVTKGAVGIGGAHGSGVVYEKQMKVGEATLSQATIGFQLGGQVYSELIFFENEATLDSFKQSKTAFSAQVSAVAAAEGVSENARYERGVIVLTLARSGLMFEASIGGQKFKFTPTR